MPITITAPIPAISSTPHCGPLLPLRTANSVYAARTSVEPECCEVTDARRIADRHPSGEDDGDERAAPVTLEIRHDRRHRATATIREFLDVDLVDTMHIAVAPVDLGRGERLWTSYEELLDRFHLDSVPSPSGVTHLLFWRR